MLLQKVPIIHEKVNEFYILLCHQIFFYLSIHKSIQFFELNTWMFVRKSLDPYCISTDQGQWKMKLIGIHGASLKSMS